MWIRFMSKMHRGLKIREGFLAIHIFSFSEHRALEEPGVCQTLRVGRPVC